MGGCLDLPGADNLSITLGFWSLQAHLPGSLFLEVGGMLCMELVMSQHELKIWFRKRA